MKSLDSFKKAVEPKRRTSKLKKFKDEIFELYESGYKIAQIQEFLAQNNCKISKSRIWDFISKKDVVIKTTTVKTVEQSSGGATIKTKSKSKALNHFLNNVGKE